MPGTTMYPSMEQPAESSPKEEIYINRKGIGCIPSIPYYRRRIVSSGMAEPVKASTVCLVIGIGLLIIGVFVQGRPDYWVMADTGAGILIIVAVILLIIGGFLRWGSEYLSK
jgi:hypothetical protein